MTKTSAFAAISLAVVLVANASLGLAATPPVPNVPSIDAKASVALKGYSVMSPALVGGPSATDYSAYYDGDGPNLLGLIRSYDDYARYSDVRGIAVASYLDASVMPQITDDPALTAVYGEFDYMFAAG
jgi:hypothetical protein